MSAKRNMSRALIREESYQNGHLTRTAFISIAILTFITFVGNFTQLQLSAALPTIVSDFGISVTTGQWLTSIFQLVMGVMVPLTAYLTRRFSTREIVLVSMVVFTIGSVFAWLGPTFLMVLIGRDVAGAADHRVFDLSAVSPWFRNGHGWHGDECGSGDRSDAWRRADGFERLAFNFLHVDDYRRNFAASCLFWIA